MRKDLCSANAPMPPQQSSIVSFLREGTLGDFTLLFILAADGHSSPTLSPLAMPYWLYIPLSLVTTLVLLRTPRTPMPVSREPTACLSLTFSPQ